MALPIIGLNGESLTSTLPHTFSFDTSPAYYPALDPKIDKGDKTWMSSITPLAGVDSIDHHNIWC